MADDYKQLIEDFFDSIDTITAARVKDLKFNKTVRCEITDNSKRDKGEYTVTDGSTKFKAFSDNMHYERGDYVNVTIPNGDYSAQKMITGRCMTSEEDVFNYISPLKSYIDITQNLIEDNVASAGLVANGQKSYVTLWEKKDFGGMKAYQKLGLRADFKVWLSALKPVEGNYGLRLSVIGRSMNTTQTESQLKYYTFTLDSNDMYGDPYKFDSFFTQEKVFDISDIPQIESIKLEFYQKQNFKNKEKKYITHEDEQGYSLGANLFVQNPYISLGYGVDKYSTDTVLLYSLEEDTYANYLTAEVKEAEMKKNEEINIKLEDLKVRQDTLEEKYQEILNDLNEKYPDKNSSDYKNRLWKIEQEYKEKKDLYQHQYEMLKNELDLNNPENLKKLIKEKNLKNIYLRWIHKDESSGRMVGIQSQDGLPDGTKIHWYRYVLKEGLSDPLAGPFWEEIDISNWESPFLYKSFIPNEKQSSEQLKVIIEYQSKDYINYQIIPNDPQIIKLDEEINKGTATDDQIAERESLANAHLEKNNYYFSEVLTFKNESEVANESTLSLIKDLVITCDEAGEKGIYNLYNSAGSLLSQIEASKKRILSASYNTLVTGDNTIDSPETVTWRIPLINTMIYPPTEGVEYTTYSQVSLTKTDDFVIGTHYILKGEDTYELVKETDIYSDTNQYFIKNQVETRIADDGSYIDITRYGSISSRIAGSEEADTMEQYFRIKPQYSQNLTNNTVYCIVNKNNKTFDASYTMHFGTTGTNGTDYTFTLEIDNAIPAMTWDTKTGITVKPKIMNYEGKDITDDFAASKFVYSWYSPSKKNDLGLDLVKETDKKECKISFNSKATTIDQAFHHILCCKTKVDITYKTNKVNTTQTQGNTSETASTEATTQPVTLTAYLAIPVRGTDKWTGFVGADKICYSHSGTDPEYYRNQYNLYYYDKENKSTKVLPNYQKVESNSQTDFDNGLYYTQTFEFTEVAIGSQEDLKPGIHYKAQSGFKPVTDDTIYNSNESYYAKTKDNRYVEIDIISNGELHKGQYFTRKDEFIVANDEDIFENVEQFYILNENGQYTTTSIEETISNNNFIKGRYYIFDSEEFIPIGADEVYVQNTDYYANHYTYIETDVPNEETFKNGQEYYITNLDYVKQLGNEEPYNSNKTYYIRGEDQEYYQIKNTKLLKDDFVTGKYYYLENNKYVPLTNIHYFNKNNEYYVIQNNNTYYQVPINSIEDLKKIDYYFGEEEYQRVNADDKVDKNEIYYILDTNSEYIKVESNLSTLKGEYYVLTDVYTLIDHYDSNAQYYIKSDDNYYQTFFANAEEFYNRLLTEDFYIHKEEYVLINNYDNHEYKTDNLYFVYINNEYIPVYIGQKIELLLSPYYKKEYIYSITTTYDPEQKYFIKTLQNGSEKYEEVVVVDAKQLTSYQYFYKNQLHSNYTKVEENLFENSRDYYVEYETNPSKFVHIFLENNETLEYGIYYTLDTVYQKIDTEVDIYDSSQTYYLKQLTNNYNNLMIDSQEELTKALQENDYCFKKKINYLKLNNVNEYNGQDDIYRQKFNKQFKNFGILEKDQINIITDFYLLKKHYRLVDSKDIYSPDERYFEYNSTDNTYNEVSIDSTSDFIFGVHYILEDGYFPVVETDIYNNNINYYIKDIENIYHETTISSETELKKGIYYTINDEKVLVTNEDVYDKDTQYFLPGNVIYDKATGTYDSAKVYYVCIAKWKIVYGQNTGYNYDKGEDNIENIKIAKCYPMISEDNTLVPLSLFIQETKPEFSAVCYDEAANNTVLWVQPIRIFLNAHSSQLLNAWDGSLTIDENNGTILSSLIGAGKKDSENRFNGILMGDMTLSSSQEPNDALSSTFYTGTGLYGYNAGIKSFGLNINGKAFFGKPGRGQILIDGNSGTIESARHLATKNIIDEKQKEGMIIDLDDGKITSYGNNSSKSIVSIDPNNINDKGYFRIVSTVGNPLMTVSDSAYFLQTNNYTERKTKTLENNKIKVTQPGKGLLFNLKDNLVTAYDFNITAYKSEKVDQIYDSADAVKYIKINSGASTYPLEIASKFKVNWSGEMYATGGAIGGWKITNSSLSNDIGAYKVSLNKATSKSTKVISVTTSTGADRFYVKADGTMYAGSANINGTINASSGKIGSWKISGGSLSAGSTTLSSNGNVTCGHLTTTGTVNIGGKSITIGGHKVSIKTLDYVITNITGITLTREGGFGKLNVELNYKYAKNVKVLSAGALNIKDTSKGATVEVVSKT